MTQSLSKGSDVVVTCKGFMNPIYQRLQFGYEMKVYDDDKKLNDNRKKASVLESREGELKAEEYEVYELP